MERMALSRAGRVMICEGLRFWRTKSTAKDPNLGADGFLARVGGWYRARAHEGHAQDLGCGSHGISGELTAAGPGLRGRRFLR